MKKNKGISSIELSKFEKNRFFPILLRFVSYFTIQNFKMKSEISLKNTLQNKPLFYYYNFFFKIRTRNNNIEDK